MNVCDVVLVDGKASRTCISNVFVVGFTTCIHLPLIGSLDLG
tara:strand:- start:249 stop:374 length:126 start_codon:yes stop_codon:yes gene_type:complete